MGCGSRTTSSMCVYQKKGVSYRWIRNDIYNNLFGLTAELSPLVHSHYVLGNLTLL